MVAVEVGEVDLAVAADLVKATILETRTPPVKTERPTEKTLMKNPSRTFHPRNWKAKKRSKNVANFLRVQELTSQSMTRSNLRYVMHIVSPWIIVRNLHLNFHSFYF